MKLGVAAVALVMPLAGALSGLYYGFFVTDTDYPLFLPLLFFVVGILLDAICINGSVFSFVLYKMPIPVVLALIGYEAASFFTGRLVSACIALCGGALGVLIDFVLLSPKPFYLARKKILIIVYIFLSIILMGIMMGVPVSNLLLGILTGNYYSLRYRDAVLSKERLHHNLVSVTVFATSVLFVSELVFGWLLWHDSVNVIEYLYHVTGWQFTQGNFLFAIIGFGLAAVLLQFLFTYYTGKILYKYRVCKIKENRRAALA